MRYGKLRCSVIPEIGAPFLGLHDVFNDDHRIAARPAPRRIKWHRKELSVAREHDVARRDDVRKAAAANQQRALVRVERFHRDIRLAGR
jgi:hypothetical protein